MSRRGRDWGKLRARDVMRLHGVEAADDAMAIPMMAPLLTRRQSLVVRKPSKAQMRAEAQAAVDAWVRKR